MNCRKGQNKLNARLLPDEYPKCGKKFENRKLVVYKITSNPEAYYDILFHHLHLIHHRIIIIIVIIITVVSIINNIINLRSP